MSQNQGATTNSALFNLISQSKPQFMFRNMASFNQGATKANGLQVNSKTARSSIDRIFINAPAPSAKDHAPVYVENKQFFFDIAFMPPAPKQITPVDKDIIHESVYGKNWRQKVTSQPRAGQLIKKADSRQQSKKLQRQPSNKTQMPSLTQAVNSSISHGFPQFYSNVSKKDTSMSLEESSISTQVMPLIEMPKKKKNLNEVATLYLSSDEESDGEGKGSNWHPNNRSMMSNYTTRLENMKLSLLSRFRASKGLSSPFTDIAGKQDNQIQKKEYTLPQEDQFFGSQNGGGFLLNVMSSGLESIEEQGQPHSDRKFKVKQKKRLNFSQRISEQAVFDYYRNYKNLKASIERDEHLLYPQSAYITQCEKSNLIPRPYGLVSYKGEDRELNVKNFLMGNRYAKAYSQGLSLLETKRVNISNNRLNENGTMAVLKGLNKKAVEEIDLSHNKLGFEGMQYLSDLIRNNVEGFSIRILILEQTGITDYPLMTFISALELATDQKRCLLQELSLACNNITCNGAEKVANYLIKNPQPLKVLNLHWNKIKIKGGLKLAEAVQTNTNLKVLDLSWNALGKTNVTFAGQLTVGEVKKKLKGQGTFQSQEEAIQQLSDIERQELELQVGKAWGKALRHNKHLMHLDLSYNCFGLDSCKILQKKLKKNHTLYGLHMAGNTGQVDTHGFIVIPGDSQFQEEGAEVVEQGFSNTKTSLNASLKKASSLTNGKPQSRSQSRQQQHRTLKQSQAEQNIKSPQKEVLFKRMEGVKAVIKKRTNSQAMSNQLSPSYSRFSNNTALTNYQHNSESPFTQQTKKGTTIMGESMAHMQSQASITQPGAALQKYKVKDNCWICEGWSEFKFDLKVPQHIGAEVYLHFDFDDYRPDLMPQISPGFYQTWRMIPPGTFHYFMSVNGVEYFANGQTFAPIEDQQIKHVNHKLEKTFGDKQRKMFNLHKLNFVESLFQQDHLQAITPRELHQQWLNQQNQRYTSSSGRNKSPLMMNQNILSMQSGVRLGRDDTMPNGLHSNLGTYDQRDSAHLAQTQQISAKLSPFLNQKTDQVKPAHPGTEEMGLVSGSGQVTHDKGLNQMNTEQLQKDIQSMLMRQQTQNQSSSIAEYYSIARIKHCVPRPDKKFLTTKEERPRTPWTFPISLFREFKPETPNLVNDCFEFDWGCLRKPKLKKSTEEDLKEKCRELYPFIREIYKRLSALGIIGTVFSIGWNVYREFMIQSLNITEKEKLKPDDCDRLFIGVNAGNQRKAQFIPQNGLVRFQFVEILMKAAIKRYFESGDVETELEAVELMAKSNLTPLQESSYLSSPYIYNQQRWRQERYWNEPCDNVLKAFAPVLTYIYNTFGGTHKKPGQKTFMTLDEFDLFIQTAGLINDMLNQRDIVIHFSYAMMCQVNEIDQERHLQATYIEFLEAFSRACDQASIFIYQKPDLNTSGEGASLDDSQSYMLNEEERQQLPLSVKIENAIQYVMKNCCPQKGFLDKFEVPKKHPKVGLFILSNKKFF